MSTLNNMVTTDAGRGIPGQSTDKFGTDATHGYERCHEKTLEALAGLLFCYVNSGRMFARDSNEPGPLKGFPTLPLSSGK